MRWSPFPAAVSGAHDFVDGLCLVAHAGDPASRHGLGIFIYTASCGMGQRALYNSDGDWLLVPQQGPLLVTTEFGPLRVAPNEICVIPRGIRFAIDPVLEGEDGGPASTLSFARGYILEVYDGHFELPDLGPIGANGLANPQDFFYPQAAYADDRRPWTLLTKYLGGFYAAQQDHSPFDVVAWRGNYAPYKYELARFNTINTVSWDHPVRARNCVQSGPLDTPCSASPCRIHQSSPCSLARATRRGLPLPISSSFPRGGPLPSTPSVRPTITAM